MWACGGIRRPVHHSACLYFARGSRANWFVGRCAHMAVREARKSCAPKLLTSTSVCFPRAPNPQPLHSSSCLVCDTLWCIAVIARGYCTRQQSCGCLRVDQDFHIHALLGAAFHCSSMQCTSRSGYAVAGVCHVFSLFLHPSHAYPCVPTPHFPNAMPQQVQQSTSCATYTCCNSRCVIHSLGSEADV